MIENYLRTAWRNLLNKPDLQLYQYSRAGGLATGFIILMWVYQGSTPDEYVSCKGRPHLQDQRENKIRG